MKNLQDYINKYNEIAENLGYKGDSIDVLVQLLANASYISEIENISYAQEASLEKASLVNSKIQHCMNMMYSVFRGSCPRVLMKIKPTKYLTLSPYDLIQNSTNFSVYYLGYYKLEGESSKKTESSNTSTSSSRVIGSSHGTNVKTTTSKSISNGDEDYDIDFSDISNLDIKETAYNLTGRFIHSNITLKPSLENESYIIECLIAPSSYTVEKTITNSNTYFIDCTEDNLSNDVFVTINDNPAQVTRNFADHILDPTKYVFDLTLPGFGSRVYAANYFKKPDPTDRSDTAGIEINTKIKATYFKFSQLSSYNESELKRLSYRGAELVKFNSTWLHNHFYKETTDGICLIEEVNRDSLNTIHYKANRDRYVNSILRSNSDIGTVLEEDFPEYVVNGGTSYVFESTGNDTGSVLTIYYIPINEYKLISETSISEFIEKEKAYYIMNELHVEKGNKYTVNFDISLELYQNSAEDLNSEVGQILKDNCEKKFNISFTESKVEELKALISKYSNIKRISNFNVSYTNENGVKLNSLSYDPSTSYFNVTYSISTIVSNSSN